MTVLAAASCGKATVAKEDPTPAPSPNQPTTAGPSTYAVLFLKTDTRRPSSDEIVGVYEGDLLSGKVVQVAWDDPPRELHASADGRYLAYVDRDPDGSTSLRVGRAADLPATETIAESDDVISSVGWARDGGMLAFFTTPIRTEDGPTEGAERLHLIRPDGSGHRVVASFKPLVDSYTYRTILGIDIQTMSVLWTRQIREGAGGSSGVTRTSIESGKSTAVGGDTGIVYLNGLALSPDLKKLYYVREAGTLVERNLDDGIERTLYEIDTKSECAIESVLVEPSADHLVFFATPEPIVEGACSSDPSAPEARTYRLRLADLARTVLRAEPAAAALRPESQAPDGAFIWFGNFEVPRTTAILDAAVGEFIPYSDADAWASRWPMAWVERSSS